MLISKNSKHYADPFDDNFKDYPSITIYDDNSGDCYDH